MNYPILYINIDSSGSSGKHLGTNGICILLKENQNESIKEASFKNHIELFFIKCNENEKEQHFFKRIIDILNKKIYTYIEINQIKTIVISIEKYIEYQKKATMFQDGATMRLNQDLIQWATKINAYITLPTASQIKSRWNDKTLIFEGLNTLFEFKKRKTKPYKDMIDALRQGCQSWYFFKGENNGK